MAKKNADKYATVKLEEYDSLGGITPIQRKNRKSLWIALGCIIGVVALFSIGFLVGYFGRTSKDHNKTCNSDQESKEADDKIHFEDFHHIFQQSVSVENLETVMRYV